MQNRIKEVRKAAGLSQAEMAKRLSLSRNFVSLLENGERMPSDRTLNDICETFNVNEEWLRTGAGEMFAQDKDEQLAEMAKEHGLSPEFAAIVKQLMELPVEVQNQIVASVVKALKPTGEKETPYQRDARLLREEADAVEQEGERLSASDLRKDA